ncbi:MAG: HAMP domain-containing protein [Pseudodesulfovibrio sp.]|nr:HAMP domain-containing protein [Pseudodesulfovibrio sp.]
MLFFKKNLILRIGTVVILVEFLVLTSLGLFYTQRFSHEVDRFLEDNIRLPGELMNRQLLKYESVSDRDVMVDLVGEEFETGSVIGADGRIYYSFQPEYVGKNIFTVSGINPDTLTETTSPTLVRNNENNKEILLSITPVTAYEGAKPFFFVLIKAGTKASQIRKKHIAALFIFGSAFCIMLTSMVIIIYSRHLVTKPLNKLKQSADALSNGELDVLIPPDRGDEIGSLASSFSDMRDSICQKIQELEDANSTSKEREGRLRALVSALPDRVVLLDWEGRYLDVSEADHDSLRFGKADLLGNRIQEMYDTSLSDRALDTIRRTITTGQSQEMEYEMDALTEHVWFECKTSRIGDESGENGTIVWVARDITYRKKIEDNLTKAKEKAENASLRLQELDQTKSALVSSVSHELRTPLTSLLGFSRLILKNFSKNFWPMAKENHTLLTKGSQIIENLNILIHEGDRLTRLINDILDLNKIEQGYTEWRDEKTHPAILVQKAVNAVSGQFNDNPKLTLLTQIDEGLPDIVVDNDRLIQVLLNLLTNAAKFTMAGTVTLRASSPQTDLIRLEVADTGPGIPYSEQERIFEIFHQAGEYGKADDRPRGAGLGLAISREIIAHYHGTIWVESEIGLGSTFFIELPAV